MAYTTVMEKLEKLEAGAKLPVGILHSILEEDWTFSFYKDFERPTMVCSSMLKPYIDNLKDFQCSDGQEEYMRSQIVWPCRIKTDIKFKDGTKGTVILSEMNFHKTEDFQARFITAFKLLKPGKLAFVAEPEISLVTAEEMIGRDSHIQKSTKFGLREGSVVMVLETLMLENIPLVRVLSGEHIRWTSGLLYDKETYDSIDNDNHWI